MLIVRLFLIMIVTTAIFFTQATQDVFNVPKFDKKTVDADEKAWKDAGFKVELMPDPNGQVLPSANFDPRFRIAWNEQGLWVLMTVKDDIIEEHADLDMIWSKDAYEIFMAKKVGDKKMFQLMISPGVTKEQAKPRFAFGNKFGAPVPREKLTAVIVSKAIPGGYISETLVPWTNLGVTPKSGDTVAFQLMADDNDGKRSFYGVFFPKSDTSRKPESMYTLKLTEKEASLPYGLGVSAAYERYSRVNVPVVAGEFAAGKQVEVKAGGKQLAESKLESKDNRASVGIVLPMPEVGTPYPPLEIYLEGKLIKTIELRNSDVLRTENFVLQKLKFESYCFNTKKFPACDFDNPYLVEKLIGPYSISVDYYDAAGNKVDIAEQAGRYGAVVNIKRVSSPRISRRFVTLFRSNNKLNWKELTGGIALNVSDIFGINTDKSKPYAAELNAFTAKQFVNGTISDVESAQLFAGLYDLSKTAESGNPVALKETYDIDHKWWTGFKRKFYGYGEAVKINAPRQKEGEPAKALREGSYNDAGMNADKMAEVEKLCQAWGKDFSNGFSVAVARRGVIFLNKNYGSDTSKPFNKAVDGQIFSTTKFVSSILFMQLVEAGHLDLDQTVDKYLPSLKDIEVKRKMTLRDLYMHMTGFPAHWGDEMNDLEEIVADYYPALTVGEKQSYQGTGLAMAGKMIENITGEVLAEYYQNHLLGPLGCKNTKANTTGAGIETVPGDLLIIGQMMLNGGAYGNQRFLNAETIEKMKPQYGKCRIGPDQTVRWGIGNKVFDTDGMSPKAFGHAGANGGFLFIDPDKDIVFAVTCGTGGKEYEEYKPKFFKAILDAVENK